MRGLFCDQKTVIYFNFKFHNYMTLILRVFVYFWLYIKVCRVSVDIFLLWYCCNESDCTFVGLLHYIILYYLINIRLLLLTNLA